ncbi:MAG: hydroxyphenylacetyl-CoA thioesterase PaaI [Acidobacteriota bacterium]
MSDAAQQLAERCVAKLLADDAYTAWLGAELREIAPGRCVLEMTVRREMTNGFGICHGGVTFAFADSALAFACNTRGFVTVAVDLSISYPSPAHTGDRLTAVGQELSGGARLSFYDVTVTNQKQQTVALFRATVYATREEHFPHE